jgi:hypothetical protein
MATQTASAQTPKQATGAAQALQKIREAYADAPEIARVALEKIVGELKSAGPQQQAVSAGRVGLRQGKVSEFTAIWNFAPGGAKRLRTLLSALGGSFQAADKVGTVHDMRFVFLDNDTKLFFCTAYDGDWDPYIDDFATKIPDEMDVFFSNLEGWPGIRSPKIKDYIAKSALTADGWYVASPNLTVAEQKRLEKVGGAVEELLDKIG